MSAYAADDSAECERIEIGTGAQLDLPERRAVVRLLRQMRHHVAAAVTWTGAGSVTIDRPALTSDARVVVMISRQLRSSERPDCWHLVIAELVEGQRRPASTDEFAAWVACGWPELLTIDSFSLANGRHAVIGCPVQEE